MKLVLRHIPDAIEVRRTAALLLPFAFVVVILTFLAALALGVQSNMRAYVGGESSWSKAEKGAVIALNAYVASGSEADYQRYLVRLAVPLGDWNVVDGSLFERQVGEFCWHACTFVIGPGENTNIRTPVRGAPSANHPETLLLIHIFVNIIDIG